jgi:DNA polymerase (family X)
MGAVLPRPVNQEVARRLDEVGRLLAEQGANRFRVQAYHRAAETLRRLDRPVDDLLRREGLEGLERLPAVGPTLARAIRVMILTGRLPMLERLRGQMDPVALLASVPGIGKALAERLHEDLGIETLEELETASYDGRLVTVAGMGEKRIAGIRDTLATRLGRVRAPARSPAGDEPGIEELLEVDREYRRRAVSGDLHRIAPRRFNPRKEAWLPILHTQRGPRHYTALFSNTARAHELGKTKDWVVLYFDGVGGERQHTVITSLRGPLRGKRIVRGLEEECARYYAGRSPRDRPAKVRP